MAKSSSTTKAQLSGFGFTMKSGNSNDYPISYADSIWDIAQQSTNLAQVMKEAGAAPSGSETGAGQYGQNEINEALADPTRTKPASAVQDYVGHKTVSGTVQETELLKAYTETTPVTSRTYTVITPAQKSAASTANIAPSDAGWYERSGAGTQANPYVYAASTDTAVDNKTYYIPNEVGQQTQQQINERLAQRANIPLEVWSAALLQLQQRVEQVANVNTIIAQLNTQLAALEEDTYMFSGGTIAIADLAARIALLEEYFGILSRMRLVRDNNGDDEIVFKGLPRYYDEQGNGYDMFVTATVAPSSSPAFIGQEYWDSQNRNLYKGVSITNNILNDWVKIN